ncbi:MAG: hypothetical protein J07HQW2_00084 [Haloquadratum walsbyi J07HQW2]|uniref:Uncharacterized protein n=2 Tax=Haloquadratum walsbyi TaxID=293091 RepID=U1PN27_9EURY|nr:MAG: hypothetical protein J07HQW2_00084 [Haloquadratum walsbyi J07HQW2]
MSAIQLYAVQASMRVESTVAFRGIMSGNTDSVHLSEAGHKKNGKPEIEDENPTHIARRYDGWFTELRSLNPEELRRLDGNVGRRATEE